MTSIVSRNMPHINLATDNQEAPTYRHVIQGITFIDTLDAYLRI
jgi:hypothetical protein